MKAKVTILMMALLMAFTVSAYAEKKGKQVQYEEVTFVSDIECKNCVKKCEANLPYEKGINDCKIDLASHTIYFKFDPAILRVVFVTLTILGLFGSDFWESAVLVAPLAYAILWICIPPARTARQRWELRGDDGSVESVRRNVESGAGEVGAAMRQVGQSPAWGTIGRILEVIVGIMLLLVSISGLFAGALALFGWQWLGLGTVLSDALLDAARDFPASAVILNTMWVKLLAIAVYALPFIGMLYASIMLLFRIKAPSWRPGLVMFVVWLVLLVALGILTIACLVSAAAV